METLLEAILAQPGTRLPGDKRLKLRRRAEKDGLVLSSQQYEQIMSLCR